jgi:hypothetical protein
MAIFDINLNETIRQFSCPHCGEQSVTVWGSISKNNVAHAVYYANLMTGHEEASARLSISIGGWGGEGPSKRNWVFIEARPYGDRYQMMVREPEESLYYGESLMGKPMTRTEVLNGEKKDEIFEVADYIAFNDPAVWSYLCGRGVSKEGRFKSIQ